jgi:hypothetical protein
MWAPNQGVSRIPCLHFESSPGLSSSVPGPIISALSAPQRKIRSGDPAHWPSAGLCASWLVSGIVVELADVQLWYARSELLGELLCSRRGEDPLFRLGRGSVVPAAGSWSRLR